MSLQGHNLLSLISKLGIVPSHVSTGLKDFGGFFVRNRTDGWRLPGLNPYRNLLFQGSDPYEQVHDRVDRRTVASTGGSRAGRRPKTSLSANVERLLSEGPASYARRQKSIDGCYRLSCSGRFNLAFRRSVGAEQVAPFSQQVPDR